MIDKPESHKLLSICIPTYNRSHTLKYLIESIESEIERTDSIDDVEIIISDNASTDDTGIVVSEYISKGLPIKYFRLEQNYGFGINMNNSVLNATGNYCWLMGSDDLIKENSIKAILDAQVSCPDIIIGNASTGKYERNFLSAGKNIYHIDDSDSLVDFIDKCTEISSLFAFISTLIIKRSFWNTCDVSDEIIKHPYTHQIRLLKTIHETTTDIMYLGIPITQTGSEKNEWNKSIYNHFALDCNTLFNISNEIFNNDEKIKLAISGLIKRQYDPVKITLSRSAASSSEWEKLSGVLRYFNISDSLLRRKKIDPIIYFAYRLAKKAKAIKNDFI